MTASTLTADNGASSGTSGIKYNGGTDGTLQIQTTTSGGTATTAVTIDNSQNVTLAGYLNAPNTFGFKNRIINGAMGIWQRGTSFSAPGGYTADRWGVYSTGTGPNVAQVSGPSGYKYALQVTGVGGNTLTSIQQRIESFNCTDLVGNTVTIQASLSASTANTFTWILGYATATDNFASTTNIATGTWNATTSTQVFTATITGLPAGAANGLVLNLLPNSGGSFTSGTVTITGVQLEKGSTATSFDYRPYGTELALCQRYYQLSGSGISGGVETSTSVNFGTKFNTTMRASPSTSLLQTAITIRVLNTTITSTGSTILANYNDTTGASTVINGFSGLTAGAGQCCITTGTLSFNSEL